MTHSATLPFPRGQRAPRQSGRPRHRGGLPRLLPSQGTVPVDLSAHLGRYGPPPYRGVRRALIPEVQAAGLTGRGGAAFPTHRKLAAVAGHALRPVVIGNGAEGEPASSKDKALLWISPHLVLDGLQLAAEAVGSPTVGLYLHRNPRLRRRLGVALAERAAAGIDAVPVELIEAPPRFLAGEESALASKVADGPALPRFKPPRATQKGVAGRPTLVQNVETLAHLALIARYGAGWFRTVGTADEPGSMLATVHRADGRTDVVEVPLGTPLRDVLGLADDAGHLAADDGRTTPFALPGLVDSRAEPPLLPGRGAGEPLSGPGAVRAVLAGGYHGAWLPASQAARLPLANAALRPAGAFVGAGVLAALPTDRCGIAESARVVRYLALESAGQCGPCFNGLPRMAAALGDLAAPSPDPRARADLERWSGLVEGRGACHHPDGTVRFVRSALRVFAAEFDRHARGTCSGTERQPFLPLPAHPALDEADWR